jgi:hypothetical protein
MKLVVRIELVHVVNVLIRDVACFDTTCKHLLDEFIDATAQGLHQLIHLSFLPCLNVLCVNLIRIRGRLSLSRWLEHLIVTVGELVEFGFILLV